MMATQADAAPVLIFGSSGTGKGALSRWIHSNGPRATLPFQVAHPALPLGPQIAAALGGTLLINEIGEYSLSEQKVLLRFLNTRSIPHPLSLVDTENSTLMVVNTRIMCSTSQALEGRAQNSLFNAELLLKLNAFRIEMPPLERRTEEFEDIAHGILEELTRSLHQDAIRSFSPEALRKLRAHDWPGNLRELRNILRVAISQCQGSRIEAEHIPTLSQQDHDRMDFKATRDQFEKLYILELLQTFGWEIDKTCEMTRMNRSTLLAKIEQYGIQRPEAIS